MKKWPWRRILTILGVVLIVVGLAPLAALLWDASTHNYRPLSMDFPLNAGQYTSPEFEEQTRAWMSYIGSRWR